MMACSVSWIGEIRAPIGEPAPRGPLLPASAACLDSSAVPYSLIACVSSHRLPVYIAPWNGENG